MEYSPFFMLLGLIVFVEAFYYYYYYYFNLFDFPFWKRKWPLIPSVLLGFPGGASGREPACQCRRRQRHREDPWVVRFPLEEEMATRSRILVWRIPWPEEAGGLQSAGSQRVGYDRAANTHTSESVTDFTVSGPLHYWHLEWMFPVLLGGVTAVHCGASTARLTFALWHPVTSPSPQSRQPRKCPGICQESAAGEGVGSKDPVENRLLLLCLCSLRSKGHNGIVTLLRKSHTQLRVTLLLDMKDGPSLPYGLGGGVDYSSYCISLPSVCCCF